MHLPPLSTSAVDRLPAHIKVLSLVGFVVATLLTPRASVWPYLADLAALLALTAAARISPGRLARRSLVVLPFLVFAALVPFVATGPRISIAGIDVSADGLVAGWSMGVRSVLGVIAAILLASTTTPAALLEGLRRPRLPAQLVDIAGFMVRYAALVVDQLARLKVAREARGFRARSLRDWRPLAATVATLFLRCLERGERVHLAMLARGWSGSMPVRDVRPATPTEWLAGAALPAFALVTALLARWTP